MIRVSALTLALLLTLAPAALAFDYAAYAPSTMRHVAQEQWRAFRAAEASPAEAERFAVMAGTRFRFAATWTGIHVPLSPEAARMIERWGNAFGRPGVRTLFDREIVVRHAGRMRRIPIQTSLLPHLQTESGPGGRLVLFVTLLGSVNGDMIFVANEFRPR